MKAYLPQAVVKAVVFWVLVTCIVAATASGLCFAWGGIGVELARRLLWSAFILASGSMIFLLVNFVFANLENRLFGTGPASPPMDPAFADRLKRAKEFREEHGGTAKTG